MALISPCLMFKDQAEEAVRFYVSLFKNAEIVSISHYGEKEIQELARLAPEHRPGPAGRVKAITFKINGQRFEACNGGPFFEFNHGISMFVRCEDQREIDELWEKLAANGGRIEECGWVRDRFGVPWQITPAILDRLLAEPDSERAQRVSVQILRSKKLVISELLRAAEG